MVERLNGLDKWVAMLAHLTVILGIPTFFYQTWEAGRSDAVKATLGYVQRFQDSDLVAARLALFEQWKAFPIGLLAKDQADEDSVRDFAEKDMAVREKQGDTRISAALFRFESFFGELSNCLKAGICSREVADQHFKEFARRLGCLYAPYFNTAQKRFGIAGFGSGIHQVAGTDKCGVV